MKSITWLNLQYWRNKIDLQKYKPVSDYKNIKVEEIY